MTRANAGLQPRHGNRLDYIAPMAHPPDADPPDISTPEPAPDSLPALTEAQQRVLGSLLEKQVTVPGSYPLSLNALRLACNQTSSRDPVVEWDEDTVRQILRDLRQRDLVRVVHGDRALKYHQRLTDHLGLPDHERALLTVLLLRGAQAPGELKVRTERLHPFADRDAVEESLRQMATGATPLVRELPKAAGQREHRWIHLLGPVAGLDPSTDSPGTDPVDRESVLAHGGPQARDAKVVAAYDAVATAYALQFGDELSAKPFDTWLLGRIPALALGAPVADVGAGPGHVTKFLADAGAAVTGFDLSPGMVQEARTAYPQVPFEVADLGRLMRPTVASAWGAIVAWYAVVHLAPSELPAALAGLARVLTPGGWLALATHVGDAIHHLDTWLGEPVDLDVVLHDPRQVRAAAQSAGLQVVEWYLRGPLAGIEPDTERLYLLARKGPV